MANALKVKLNAHYAANGTVLADLCTWAEAIRTVYTAHLADTTEHKVADTTNVLTAATATDHATLYLLVKDILDQYAAHNADAEAAGALTYHYVQNPTTHVLASVAAPTSLADAIVRMTDAKAKYNAHDADGASHALSSLHQNATALVAIGAQIHPTSAQAAITTANATTLATLYALAKACADSYAAHNADAILVADWVYHKAAGTTHVLASVSTPTNLNDAITMVNDIKTKANLHLVQTAEHGIADTVLATTDATVGTGEHPASADTLNTVSTASAVSTLTEVIALQTELLTDYDAHHTDNRLSADWAFHEAQGADRSHATTPPTTVQTALTIANSLKAAYNLHDADSTAHTTGATFAVATSDAAYGAVIRMPVNGVKTSDTITASILVAGTGSVTTVTAACNVANYIDFTFSGDPQNDCVFSYVVTR